MKRTIPFVPLPLEKALRVSKPFLFIGNKLLKIFPTLDLNLRQAEIDVRGREYINVAIFSSLFWFSILFCIFIVLGKIVGKEIVKISFFLSSVVGVVSFLYVTMYPRLVVSKKVKRLEKDLLYAMRHLYIQLRSGVTLFDSLVSVAKGEYGVLSEEIKLCVNKISTGWPEEQALEELALRNPSLTFRRALWQISNAMRAGTDLGDTLETIVNNIANEQRIVIRRYGSQLNPMAMMYMMLGVVVPSLGITFLMILSSFSGLPITQTLFVIILIMLGVFQFSFIGFIKSRRPSIEV